MIETLIKPKAKVLIIDDEDQLIVEIMKSNVQDEWFPDGTVHAAIDFDDTEEKIRYGKYDFILLDYDFVDWTSHRQFSVFGTKVLDFIRTHSPGTTVIAISGHDHRNLELIKAGAKTAINKEALLRKPIRVSAN